MTMATIVGSMPRIPSSTSNPEMPGIFRSTRTRSGANSCATFRPSVPSGAVAIS